MRLSTPSLLLWLVLALLLALAWLTVTKRLGRSRHGYAGVPVAAVGRTAG